MFNLRSNNDEAALSAAGARKRKLRRKYIAVPTNFNVLVSSSQSHSSWGSSSGMYVDGYKLHRDGVEVADIPFNGPLYYIDSGLDVGVSYLYTVYAYNRFGGQSDPTSRTVTPGNGPPVIFPDP